MKEIFLLNSLLLNTSLTGKYEMKNILETHLENFKVETRSLNEPLIIKHFKKYLDDDQYVDLKHKVYPLLNFLQKRYLSYDKKTDITVDTNIIWEQIANSLSHAFFKKSILEYDIKNDQTLKNLTNKADKRIINIIIFEFGLMNKYCDNKPIYNFISILRDCILGDFELLGAEDEYLEYIQEKIQNLFASLKRSSEDIDVYFSRNNTNLYKNVEFILNLKEKYPDQFKDFNLWMIKKTGCVFDVKIKQETRFEILDGQKLINLKQKLNDELIQKFIPIENELTCICIVFYLVEAEKRSNIIPDTYKDIFYKTLIDIKLLSHIAIILNNLPEGENQNKTKVSFSDIKLFVEEFIADDEGLKILHNSIIKNTVNIHAKTSKIVKLAMEDIKKHMEKVLGKIIENMGTNSSNIVHIYYINKLLLSSLYKSDNIIDIDEIFEKSIDNDYSLYTYLIDYILRNITGTKNINKISDENTYKMQIYLKIANIEGNFIEKFKNMMEDQKLKRREKEKLEFYEKIEILIIVLLMVSILGAFYYLKTLN